MAIIKIRNAAIDLDAAEIPNLPATKITSGTLDNARISLDAAEIPNLDTAKITSGTLADARVPNLNASKITAGTIADARIPANALNSNVDLTNLSAASLTSGTIPNARYGTPTFNASNLTNVPGGSTWNVISTATASNSASIDFTSGIDNTYDDYVIIFRNLIPANESFANLYLQVRQSGNYKTNTYVYHASRLRSSSDAYNGNDETNAPGFELADSVSSDANYGASGIITLPNLTEANYQHCLVDSQYKSSTGRFEHLMLGGTYNNDSSAVDGLRIKYSSQNISSGSATLYGIKNT